MRTLLTLNLFVCSVTQVDPCVTSNGKSKRQRVRLRFNGTGWLACSVSSLLLGIFVSRYHVSPHVKRLLSYYENGADMEYETSR